MWKLLAVPLLAWCSLPGAAPAENASRAPGAATIVEEIRRLEGVRDPKCHATASRLEDLIYGTPFNTDARFRKNDLQKELVVGIWSAASAQARKRKLTVIPKDVLVGVRERLFQYRTLPNGDWRINVKANEYTITNTDKRQYSTVAYALRAILAAQQDQLEVPKARLLPLSEEAVDSLKEAVDLFTLAVMQEADRRARKTDRQTIEVAEFERAWQEFSPVTKAPDAGGKRAPVRARHTDYPLLKQIIAQKIDSFERYNKITTQVFLRNLQVYFARVRWPSDQKAGAEIRALFTEAMVVFARDFLTGVEDISLAKRRPFIRAEDAEAYAQRLVPHKLNVYEDAIFFPNLPREKQIELEAYDMDAFRDGGLHWRYLQYVVEDPKFRGRIEPDPFAAEIITENIAQFGVLLLREAGRISKEQGHAHLHPDSIGQALVAIQGKIDEHAATPMPHKAKAKIVSSADSSATTRFVKVTERTGIDYMHRMADWLARAIRSYTLTGENVGTLIIPPAFQGSGVAAEDIDNDGRPDILLLGGLGNKLYKNNGDGSFTDITANAGINWLRPDGRPGEPRQAIIADFDNDGWQDILITYVNDKHRLYRNLGGGRFRDVTERSGLGGEGLVGGPATVLDIDNDGLLDVYIGYFGDYVHGVLPTLSRRNSNALPNKLFRNQGGLRFEDITAGSGVDNRGWAQAIGHTDIDGDGLQDIICGNDFGINAYYRNLGNGKFEDVAARLGTDKPSYTMGIGIADLNGDGMPDIYISNIVLMNKDEKYVLPTEDTVMKFNPEKLAKMRVVEANDLFLSHARGGKLTAYELSDLVGRGYGATGWSWGADFFDMDNDGDDDLYVVNGTNAYNMYSKDNPYYTDPSGQPRKVEFPVENAETNVLFENRGGKLNLVPDSGAGLHGNSRSAAYLDFDGDGDLDVVLNGFQEKTVVLKNTAEKLGNHWLAIRLVGDPQKRTSRDAIGARIVVTAANGLRVWREVRSTGSYLSANPKEQHFGLREQKKADVSVRWPNGERSEYKNVAADGRYVIRQGSMKPAPFRAGRSTSRP